MIVQHGTRRRVAVRVGAGIAAFVLSLGLAYVFVLDPRFDEVLQEEATEPRLKEDYREKKRRAVNLDAYRKQLLELDAEWARLSRLPTSFDRPFAGVLEAASRAGAAVERMESGEAELRREYYAELAGTVVVTGSFAEVAAFVANVAAAPGMTALHDLRIESPSPGGTLRLQAAMKAYRARTAAELAAARPEPKKGGTRR